MCDQLSEGTRDNWVRLVTHVKTHRAPQAYWVRKVAPSIPNKKPRSWLFKGRSNAALPPISEDGRI